MKRKNRMQRNIFSEYGAKFLSSARIPNLISMNDDKPTSPDQPDETPKQDGDNTSGQKLDDDENYYITRNERGDTFRFPKRLNNNPSEIFRAAAARQEAAQKAPQAESDSANQAPSEEPIEPPKEPKTTLPPVSPEPLIAPIPFATSKIPHLKTKEDIFKFIGVSEAELKVLLEIKADKEARDRYKMFLLGVLFMPITLAGALFGFVRGYKRLYEPQAYLPFLSTFIGKRIIQVAMTIGAILAWLIVLGFFVALYAMGKMQSITAYSIAVYIGINAVLSIFIVGIFKIWQNNYIKHSNEADKFGSARFARVDELKPYTSDKAGYYLGNGICFYNKGHLLTVAGTRGGKGTNIIVPNLLDASKMKTSWVVIDPKGENAAITGNFQRSKGRNVVILNPWELLTLRVGYSTSYNPLDILSDISDLNLVDDVQMIAEMIVPLTQDDKNAFFVDSARMIISGLLLHLVTTQEGDAKTLTTLWEWARYTDDAWQDLLAEMGLNDTPSNGVVVQNARKEILKLMESGGETFGSIMSNVLLSTDFLKSPALQSSLKSGFDPKTLADGKTTIYVIIPADKLKSHARWLRLVTTSLMRAVIRKPKNRVTFLLDEFAALGYLPEIETALSTYAGYNVTVWPILQSLIQLSSLYGKNWETFIANCTVRQYFSINDNFSAEYISKAMGETTNVIKKGIGDKMSLDSNKRSLITPDELRRYSGKNIFMFIGDLPPTYVKKTPYYTIPELIERAAKNPYMS